MKSSSFPPGARHYTRVLETLSRHLAAINARGMLNRAVRVVGTTSHTLDTVHHGALVEALRPGLRVFLDPEQQNTVLRELRELGGSAAEFAPASIPIKTEADISIARNAARGLCQRMGARALLVQRVATVVSELARNIVSYTSGGVIDLIPSSELPRRVRVRATDRGPGISNLQEILAGKYRSRTGLGLGLLGAKRLADRFDVLTSPLGTRVEVDVNL
jgi:serine/threonine-protein kinase RsbT